MPLSRIELMNGSIKRTTKQIKNKRDNKVKYKKNPHPRLQFMFNIITGD
uniref:Uncharacterized protein n=1 Tax=Glossina brevipalpis TaxID=37001 RepID=A0A1A9WIS4_9MUSC